MIDGHTRFKERVEFGKLMGEIRLLCLVVKPLKRARRQRQAARRLANAQVDATRRQRGEHAERFRYLKRAVMLQHHATGTHADA
jgi:hypothetical protein